MKEHPRETNLLIIGAGPFGLSLAAYCVQHGIDHTLVGRPMEFWRAHMPRGMYLRSGCDWHLDPCESATIERFLAHQGLSPAAVEPLSLELYLSYAKWFQEQQRVDPWPVYVQRLDHIVENPFRFHATLEDGHVLRARQVAIAVGFRYFKNVARELAELLPEGRFSHTCDLVAFDALAGRRCLIVGGRQSAFEWAALIREAGAAEVHLSYRHASPAFAAADWTWVAPIVDAIAEDPGWFRRLPEHEQAAVVQRLWAEGRLKIEPWLARRVLQPGISLWPHTRLERCDVQGDGTIVVSLDNRQQLLVDHIVLATGYKVDVRRIPFLAEGNIAARLDTRNGYPVLDTQFQTSVPGLFMTSMAANQDFGPFFAFTVSTRASARLIGAAVASNTGSYSAAA